MALSDLASIAIIVQGILFVVSIVLVWYQLRENTKLVRAANTQKLVELSVPFNLRLAQDLTWWLTLHENIYHQWRNKLIDEETFSSWTRDLEFYVKRQQLGNHWPDLNSFFESSFAQHVTVIIASLAKETE